MNPISKAFGLALLAAFLVNLCRAEGLPPCDEIPKLLCCTGRVLEKCLAGCVDYVNDKCPHKLHNFDKIHGDKSSNSAASASASVDKDEHRTVEPVRRAETHEVALEGAAAPLQSRKPAPARPRTHGAAPLPSGGRARQFADLPQEGFIEQPAPVPSGGRGNGASGGFSRSRTGSRSGGDYDQLNPQYPVTEVTDADLSSECGTAQSKPAFSPCLSRKSVDDLFLSCCRQHVPSNCHALCTYEHREHVAAETLIAAVQSDGCDLRYLSSVLYCANQNRDNRECCEHLGLSSSSLGVGERCLRMCNVARSGQSLGSVEKNDLVCLSNWNVIMYCARAGLRTIN